MRVVNEEYCSDGSQGPVGGVEEGISGLVVLRSYPLALEYAPQRLGDVEVRRVRREVEEEKPSALPNGPHLLHGLASVDAGVVKHDDGVPFPRFEGQPVEEVGQLVGGYAAPRGEAFVSVVPCGHAEYIEAGYFLGRDVDVLFRELPSVGDIALGANMALVGIVEVYPSVISLSFKFLQLLGLLVELRRGFSPWAFPYTLISCANADKKRLNVDSPCLVHALPVPLYRPTDGLLVRAVHNRLAPPARTGLQPFDAFFLVSFQPFPHGMLFHPRPLADFRGGQPIRFQE